MSNFYLQKGKHVRSNKQQQQEQQKLVIFPQNNQPTNQPCIVCERKIESKSEKVKKKKLYTRTYLQLQNLQDPQVDALRHLKRQANVPTNHQ